MKKWKWPIAWLVQTLEMLALGLAAALVHMLGPIPYGIAVWCAMPLAGMYAAFRATRRGLLNYAAWIAPPLCMWLAHAALWGYAPSAGPVLVCAFVSLVGAAAGEVLNQQKK